MLFGDVSAVEDMFDALSRPIEKALKAANVSIADVNFVEVVGGAWRVPKVQSGPENSRPFRFVLHLFTGFCLFLHVFLILFDRFLEVFEPRQVLSAYFSGEQSRPLGQHLNGEEAGAMGAALVAANSSSSFRVAWRKGLSKAF